MYERSAIVLERYFEKLFGFTKEYNLKENYKKFISLIEETKEYIEIEEKEESIIEKFDSIAKEIGDIQKKQKKINADNLNLENLRGQFFDEISDNPKLLEQKMIKVENTINQNNEKLKDLREQYISSLMTFIERQAERNQYDRTRRQIEVRHLKMVKEFIEKFNLLDVNDIENLQNFINVNIDIPKQELMDIMIKNGNSERIKFNESVIENAVEHRLEIAKKEAELYINMFDKSRRMIAIIESDNIKLGRIEKNIRDTSVKLSFLAAEKEYIFNFLDYERMTLLNGKDSHDKLMEDACEKFNQDIEQIENLYELIHKETLNKATKKMYKEKYNVDYLQKIEDKERNFEDELTNSRIKKTSVINSNFWRIEGIKNVYYLFRKEVTEKYERDLSEFDIREEKAVEENEKKSLEDIVLPTLNEEYKDIINSINDNENLDLDDDFEFDYGEDEEDEEDEENIENKAKTSNEKLKSNKKEEKHSKKILDEDDLDEDDLDEDDLDEDDLDEDDLDEEDYDEEDYDEDDYDEDDYDEDDYDEDDYDEDDYDEDDYDEDDYDQDNLNNESKKENDNIEIIIEDNLSKKNKKEKKENKEEPKKEVKEKDIKKKAKGRKTEKKENKTAEEKVNKSILNKLFKK